MTELQQADIELVEPRYIKVRFRGDIDADAMTEVMDAIAESVANEPYFLLEADVAEVHAVSADARRIAADRLRQMPDRAIAAVGGGFAQRLLSKLVLTAVSMLSPNPRNVTEFFQDHEKARAWLRNYASTYESKFG